MSVSQIDPALIHNTAQTGKATLTNDALDILISTINALIAQTGGGGGNPNRFIYMVTGAEAGFGTSTITIPLGRARANTNYTAQVQLGSSSVVYIIDAVPTAQFTTTTIQLKCSMAPAIGDTFIVVAEDIA